MRWRDIRTGLTVVTQPPFEPISRAEAKWHLRIDHTDEDHVIDGFIAAARRQVEQDTGRTAVNTVYALTVERFPEERYIDVPRVPLSSIGSVKSYDADDTETTMSSGDYRADTALHRIVLNDDATWPSDLRKHSAGAIRFTAGGNAAAVSVSTLTSTGTAPDITATVTTDAAHGYSTGDRVTVVGAAEDAYNGTFAIVVTGASTCTYGVVSGTPATPATGTITARLLHVPPSHHLAMLMLIEHFSRNRGAVVEAEMYDLPMGYCALISGADRVYAMA